MHILPNKIWVMLTSVAPDRLNSTTFLLKPDDLAGPWLLSMVLGKARWVVREQSQGVQENRDLLNQVLHYRGALEVFILPDDCGHERRNKT